MHIKILNRHYLIFLNTEGRTKVTSYIPNFRDLTLIIHDVLRDSQSRRIACNWQERCPETIPASSSIHSKWTFFHSTGIVPGKTGNGSDNSFVNHTVCLLKVT